MSGRFLSAAESEREDLQEKVRTIHSFVISSLDLAGSLLMCPPGERMY